MTVSELIARLSDPRIPPDAVVVMAGDAEGNGYSPLEVVDAGLYEAENSHSGSCYPPDDEDAIGVESCVPCVALWPVN